MVFLSRTSVLFNTIPFAWHCWRHKGWQIASSQGRRDPHQWPGYTLSTLRCLQRKHIASVSAAQAETVSTETSYQQGPEPSRLLLIDAHALLYRYNFAYGPRLLTSSTGEDTSIAYGFLNTLLSLLELHPPPTHLAVVFDAPGKTFRHELFQGYKGQRPPMPETVKEALPRIREVLEVMGIPTLRVHGVEADDVIGTVATRAVDEGFFVAIASPDKDFFQLLRPNLQLLRLPKKGTSTRTMVAGLVPVNVQAFVDEYGVQPSQWADVLALCGDASDNVPGVKGIGIKTATALMQKFGSLEATLAQASEVQKKKQREELSSEEGVAAARLSLRLVTIQTNLNLPPVRVPLSELALHPPSQERRAAVSTMFREIDFKQHDERLSRIWQSMF